MITLTFLQLKYASVSKVKDVQNQDTFSQRKLKVNAQHIRIKFAVIYFLLNDKKMLNRQNTSTDIFF